MPELPEVEVVRQGLASRILGLRIEMIRFSNRRLRLPMPRAQLHLLALEQTISGVRRRAKYLIIELSNQARVIIHLGMTGRLGQFQPETSRAKHDHLFLLLSNGKELRFNDCRRFGSIQIVPSGASEQELFNQFGPEPFSKEFSTDYLTNKSQRKNQPVKNFLMDNRIVVGIGNIYASEILHKSRISPFKKVNEVQPAEWSTIICHCRTVLQQAIDAGGSTISDFLGSDGKKGYFQIELAVYGRAGQHCKQCNEIISKKRLAGRTSFWCKNCQQ